MSIQNYIHHRTVTRRCFQLAFQFGSGILHISIFSLYFFGHTPFFLGARMPFGSMLSLVVSFSLILMLLLKLYVPATWSMLARCVRYSPLEPELVHRRNLLELEILAIVVDSFNVLSVTRSWNNLVPIEGQGKQCIYLVSRVCRKRHSAPQKRY